MRTIKYKDNKRIKKDVKPLFISAFPKEERPPAFIFFKNANRDTQDLYAYYDNDEFIGFASLTYYKDIVYIFFLAVSENKRNQGYGSKILNLIKEEYKDKVILLCYEEVDDKYPDNEMRIKRKNFYRKNGFIDNGVKTNEFGVIFETGYIGSHKVSFEDYVEIFILSFSEYCRPYIKKEN